MSALPDLPPVVDPRELAERMVTDTRVTLLDVRTPTEFESIHIPGSHNVPLDHVNERIDELVNVVGERVVLVCRSGARSRQAEEAFRAADHPHVHVLHGGVTAWQASGLPVNCGRATWAMERQVRGVAGGLVLASTLAALLVRKPLGLLAAGVGGGLLFSAVTDSCGMAAILSKLPYNRAVTCNVDDVLGRIARAAASGQRAS